MDLLTSRRLWSALMALFGALTGGVVLSEAQVQTQVDHIIGVIGIVATVASAVLSAWSKLRP